MKKCDNLVRKRFTYFEDQAMKKCDNIVRKRFTYFEDQAMKKCDNLCASLYDMLSFIHTCMMEVGVLFPGPPPALWPRRS